MTHLVEQQVQLERSCSRCLPARQAFAAERGTARRVTSFHTGPMRRKRDDVRGPLRKRYLLTVRPKEENTLAAKVAGQPDRT
jgi:hypothetical protein